jgi:hypothetical protein
MGSVKIGTTLWVVFTATHPLSVTLLNQILSTPTLFLPCKDHGAIIASLAPKSGLCLFFLPLWPAAFLSLRTYPTLCRQHGEHTSVVLVTTTTLVFAPYLSLLLYTCRPTLTLSNPARYLCRCSCDYLTHQSWVLAGGA